MHTMNTATIYLSSKSRTFPLFLLQSRHGLFHYLSFNHLMDSFTISPSIISWTLSLFLLQLVCLILLQMVYNCKLHNWCQHRYQSLEWPLSISGSLPLFKDHRVLSQKKYALINVTVPAFHPLLWPPSWTGSSSLLMWGIYLHQEGMEETAGKRGHGCECGVGIWRPTRTLKT